MNINWMKLDVNILDDTKIRLIREYPDGDSIIVLWLGILCLGMKSDDPGVIKIADGLPYTPEELGSIFKIPLKTVQLGIELFCKFGMIQVTEGGLMEIVNFRKHQSVDEIEYQRERNRQKVAKFREKKRKLLESDVTVTCNRVTDRVDKIRLDKNREDKIKIDKKFKKPTYNEIAEYSSDISYSLDANKFLDYYEANGWKVGKNSMKDWRAAVRTWKRNEDKFNDNEQCKQEKIFNKLRSMKNGQTRQIKSNDNETF